MGTKKNQVNPTTEATELDTERGLLDKGGKISLPKDEVKELKIKDIKNKVSPSKNTDRGENLETDRGLGTDRPLLTQHQDTLAPVSNTPKNPKMSLISFRNSYRNLFTLK